MIRLSQNLQFKMCLVHIHVSAYNGTQGAHKSRNYKVIQELIKTYTITTMLIHWWDTIKSERWRKKRDTCIVTEIIFSDVWKHSSINCRLSSWREFPGPCGRLMHLTWCIKEGHWDYCCDDLNHVTVFLHLRVFHQVLLRLNLRSESYIKIPPNPHFTKTILWVYTFINILGYFAELIFLLLILPNL